MGVEKCFIYRTFLGENEKNAGEKDVFIFVLGEKKEKANKFFSTEKQKVLQTDKERHVLGGTPRKEPYLSKKKPFFSFTAFEALSTVIF